MNTRKICDLGSDFHNAFASELADELDKHIDGYELIWDYYYNCLRIAKNSTTCAQLLIHNLKLILTVAIFSRQNHNCNQLCVYRKHYELSDPQHTPQTIGPKIADMMNPIYEYYGVPETLRNELERWDILNDIY